MAASRESEYKGCAKQRSHLRGPIDESTSGSPRRNDDPCCGGDEKILHRALRYQLRIRWFLSRIEDVSHLRGRETVAFVQRTSPDCKLRAVSMDCGHV